MRRSYFASIDPLTLSLSRREREQKECLTQAELIHAVLENREAVMTNTGALATWNPAHSTGRIPKQTFIVRDDRTEHTVDWQFSLCNPMEPRRFDELFNDTQKKLNALDHLYVTERCVGADPSHTLAVRTLSDRALTALFTYNMFLDGFGKDPFELLVLSDHVADQCIAIDFYRRRGVILGTKYLGCVKKLMFTVMNYLLPAEGVLPLHCSAVEDQQGDTHLFLGLSGTGKTTLSSDPRRTLIGDDEHLWSNEGVANMENGCYAKLINLSQEKEPEIYKAVFGPYSLPLGGRERERGSKNPYSVIIENAMVYPDGSVDLSDSRLTENSRASYPLEYLKNIKKEKCGGHPKTIVFLTADAHGVLPPITRLTTDQALLWFLMGYTSKLAGTETGVTTPQSTFSRFFGGPFMPCQPQVYLDLFREKITQHKTDVYLVNTGWIGGPYGVPRGGAAALRGVGKRMEIALTRRLVDAALSGELQSVECFENARFHIGIPEVCPGVDPKLLNPKQTWADPVMYDRAADTLAREFTANFDKNFLHQVPPEIAAMCPGK